MKISKILTDISKIIVALISLPLIVIFGIPISIQDRWSCVKGHHVHCTYCDTPGYSSHGISAVFSKKVTWERIWKYFFRFGTEKWGNRYWNGRTNLNMYKDWGNE